MSTNQFQVVLLKSDLLDLPQLFHQSQLPNKPKNNNLKIKQQKRKINPRKNNPNKNKKISVWEEDFSIDSLNMYHYLNPFFIFSMKINVDRLQKLDQSFFHFFHQYFIQLQELLNQLFDSIFRIKQHQRIYMSEVLLPNNGYNLTFGKQQWKQFSNPSGTQQHNNSVTNKKTYQKQQLHKQKQLQQYTAQFQKVVKKNNAHKIQFDKQNQKNKINSHSLSNHSKLRRRSSIFYHNNKKLPHYCQWNVYNLGEYINRQKNSYEQSLVIKKQNGFSLYDLQLKNRLKLIENSTKNRTERYQKLFSQHQNNIKNYSKPTQKVENKYLHLQNRKKAFPKFYQVQNPPKQQYKVQMRKIDGLIDKINTRIRHSMKNFS